MLALQGSRGGTWVDAGDQSEGRERKSESRHVWKVLMMKISFLRHGNIVVILNWKMSKLS